MRIYLLLLILFLPASIALAQSKAQAHRHRLTSDETQAWEAEVEAVQAPVPDKKLKREELARNRNYESFSVYQEGNGYRIFFTDLQTKKTYEIRGAGQPHRPFSDLWWKNQRLLVFDSWSNPQQGAHYEFDAKIKKIKKILIFRETSQSKP